MRLNHYFLLITTSCLNLAFAQNAPGLITLYPQHLSTHINPDCHLTLLFTEVPVQGKSGKIKVFESSTNKLIDSLDLSIPAGPTVKDTTRVKPSPLPYEYSNWNFTNATTRPGTPSGIALPNPGTYQLDIIGGFTDAFHFYPVIIHDKTATIYLHHNLLEYDKNYYVTIDAEVFPIKGFQGIEKQQWSFQTKKAAPSKDKTYLLVDGEGKGDFNTVQGALDFVPTHDHQAITIFIKKGFYEELVYVRKKSNITLLGEDREKTVVTYTNYEAFNAHPKNIATNELPGTFPSRRGAFTVDNCNDISLINLSIKNPSDQQAEGLLITGERNMLYHVNVRGGGDALQVNGSAYFKDCKIEGGGDMILGRGAAFFDHCEFYSKYTFMWIRNTAANHGNVFMNCKFKGMDTNPTDLAREPDNKGKTYPYSEAVLINCTLENILPQGWGQIDGPTENIHYWEYNSVGTDGKPVDVSQRHPVSRQLVKDKDALIIKNYSDPSFVFGGWKPEMEKLIKVLK